ncbi:MAG: hypothetical protein EOP10_00135 [Proteobacteria bacterium]|nr:MAG: hypothetical protein EOP10_00135 [Pseudomonadota bacterium]
MKKYLLPLAVLASVDAAAQSPEATPTVAQSPMTRPIGAGQVFNPDTSINFLTLYKSQKREGADKTEPDGGFMLQEAEIQFMANVDAYFRAVAMFAVHPEHDHEHEEGAAVDPMVEGEEREPEEKGYGIEPEEVYLETTALPYVTLKLGRFHADLGRHNQLHTHAYPFVDAPLINQRLLGEEGLIENGLSASILVPLPWYAEVSAQALQGDSPELFSSESSSDVATVYRVRNLFDLTDEATLDLGLSAARGHNFWNGTTNVRGADVSLKWRPTQGGKYQSISLAAEYLQGEVGDRLIDSKLSGYSTWLQYQATQRLWVQIRQEEAKSEDEGAKAHRKLSGLIGFNPTEFSSLRLQLDQLHDDEEKPLNSLLFQANITIGAHPAHAYN